MTPWSSSPAFLKRALLFRMSPWTYPCVALPYDDFRFKSSILSGEQRSVSLRLLTIVDLLDTGIREP